MISISRPDFFAKFARPSFEAIARPLCVSACFVMAAALVTSIAIDLSASPVQAVAGSATRV